MEDSGADAAAQQKAKESFEKIIKECVDIGYVFEGPHCKFCNGDFNTPRHPKSAYHNRNMLCTKLFEAHNQFKTNRTLENLKTIKEILETRNKTALLLCLAKWPIKSSGHNVNRNNPDGARIWFTAFIVELGQICRGIVVQDTETDGSLRQTAAHIQAILEELQKPSGASAVSIPAIAGPGVGCGGVAGGGSDAYGYNAVSRSPALLPAGRPDDGAGRDGAAYSMAAAGSACEVRPGGDADEVGSECAASSVPRA